MKKTLAALACVVALLGVLAPAAFAQAPAPKVTIVGLFDQITSAGRNIYDGDFTRSSESEWYARTRFRPDFTFEVGRTKAVLGLEIDLQYGASAVGATKPGTGNLANPGLGLNTDVAGVLEVKWIYTEFDLTGPNSLLPFIPVATVARAGGQPFATLANYRPTYAAGDFAGLSAITTFAPNIKTTFAWVQVGEETWNQERGVGFPTGAGVPAGRLTSGDDYAVIVSAEITPFKGLDIKPMYSYFLAEGLTSGAARRNAVFWDARTNALYGVNGAVAVPACTPGLCFPLLVGGTASVVPGAGRGGGDLEENRHTIGLDARWRMGPFSFDPTVMFQWGERDMQLLTSRGFRESDARAWLIDLQGGYQLGPLLLEGRYIYSTGSPARQNLSKKIRYFEPLDTDTGYYVNWANIMALGVDYFNGGGGTLAGMSTNIGYDRYGRHQFGVRATYSLTPALAFYGIVSPTWTAEEVDTDAFVFPGGIRVPSPILGANPRGDDSYIGTELDLGTTWRFAPNTAFDLVWAYLFAGSALDAPNIGKSVAAGRIVKDDAEDGWTVAARLRLSF